MASALADAQHGRSGATGTPQKLGELNCIGDNVRYLFC